jgi:hypothetical protein
MDTLLICFAAGLAMVALSRLPVAARGGQTRDRAVRYRLIAAPRRPEPLPAPPAPPLLLCSASCSKLRIPPPKTLDHARLRDDDLRLHFFARPCTA